MNVEPPLGRCRLCNQYHRGRVCPTFAAPGRRAVLPEPLPPPRPEFIEINPPPAISPAADEAAPVEVAPAESREPSALALDRSRKYLRGRRMLDRRR